MTTKPVQQQDPKVVHQRAMRMQIILPVVLVVLFIGLLLVLMSPLTPRGLSLVADVMLIAMCLLPLLVCLVPFYLLMIAAVALMSRAGGATTKQVRRVRVMTTNLADQTRTTSDNINRKTVNLSVRIAALDRLWSLFDRPEKTE